MLESHENAIEFLYGDKIATGTFCSTKYVNKIKKLSESKPEECNYYENEDGSIVAHFPVKWVKISPPRTMTDEQKEIAAERMKNYLRQKGEKHE